MQSHEAVARLQATGQLTGDSEFTFDPPKYQIGRKSAYSWMQAQMRHRIPTYDEELPIWGLLSRPDAESKPKEDRLLLLEIPKNRMLMSFYQPRCRLLGVMACIEKTNRWPESGFDSLCPYFSTSKSEKERREFVEGVSNGSGARTSRWDEEECRTTWERMFDLTLAQNSDFLWSPIYLQTMMPMIYSSDLREVI
jgi:hypothetical protein